MLAAGWADEVRALAQVVPPSAPAWNASGYRAIRELVEGRISEAAARERVLIDTRQYAKRQRTWFRHQIDERSVVRVDPDDPAADVGINEWWDGRIDA
jgi:tRNA dimethylallyltransferase